MRDLRETKIAFKSITKLSELAVTEEAVKEILTALGVEPTEELMREAIGYLSSNSMGLNMDAIHDFLKSKSIMSMKDMRKKN